MKFDGYKCDVCNKVKMDLNHWWKVITCGPLAAFSRWDRATELLKHLGVDEVHEYDICSEGCLHEKISQVTARGLS